VPKRPPSLVCRARHCGAGRGCVVLWPPTAITPENAAKIEKGMTLTDVETILGGPARDESAGAVIADLGSF